MSSATHQMSDFHVPTVDISQYYTDPTSSKAEKVIAEIRKACLSTGFFQVVGHGIPKELRTEVFKAAKTFFDLPLDVKKTLDAKSTVGHRGYDVLESQSYEPGVLPDLKEGFYIGIDIPETDPRVTNRRFFMGPNVWPTELSASSFQQPCEEYYKAIFALGLSMIQLIAFTLPYGPSIFDEFVSNQPAAPMRLLHYPPAVKNTAKPQLGASAHTDFGAITLLLTDDNPGLEVLDTSTNEWRPIEPNPDAYVVNIGDMLSMWTGNQYKSSLHRVINKNPTDRYSVVFFFDGNLDCSLTSFDGSCAGDSVSTVEQHMLRRMASSYGTTKV